MYDEPLTPYYYLKPEENNQLDVEKITIQAYLKGMLTAKLNQYFQNTNLPTPRGCHLYFRHHCVLMAIQEDRMQ